MEGRGRGMEKRGQRRNAIEDSEGRQERGRGGGEERSEREG